MTESTMPATETSTSSFDERNAYELAFHVLPTVAEGEVSGVYETLKGHITKYGEIFGEEAPERVDLAYPIAKSMEGKNRNFTSAYFGWVRFKLDAEKLSSVTEEISSMGQLLRHLIVKLTAYEEAHPVRFHEVRKSVKMVEVVHEDAERLDESHAEIEENVEVSEEALDSSLEKITKDDIEKK